LLARFYGSLDFSLRGLLHFKSLAALGYPFDKVLLEEPWRTYDVLTSLVGRHNAELILTMLQKWLNNNGCAIDPETLRKYLTTKELWTS
ncbi:MAG: hypothetical protein ACP5I3_10945, partial [Thermoproteus sp.]